MAKFYCAACGVELTCLRKAIPGKGYIANLIEQHECEGHAIKEVEEGQETVLQIIDKLKPIGRPTPTGDKRGISKRHFEPGDRRDDKSKVTSSAPANLLNSVKNMIPSEEELSDDL